MHFSMASNYLRKSYKQRLPQTESLLNTANYIPVRQMVSSTFGTLVLSFFSSAVLLAIFPWIALLFTTFLIYILFAAARRCVPSEMTSQLPIDGEKRAEL